MTGFQHPDNGPYLLNNATTAGHQTVDLGSAPVKYVMCENKTPPLTEDFVAWAGNCFQLPAWCYTAHGLFVVFLFFRPCPMLFLDGGIWLLRTTGNFQMPLCHLQLSSVPS